MEPPTTVYDEVQRWTKRHSSVLSYGFATTAGIMYLWESNCKYLASTFSLLAIGGACLYWSLSSRDKVSSRHVIVITGCDSGLGFSLAMYCHEMGATVIAGVQQTDGPAANELMKQNIVIHPLDITCAKSVANFGASIRAVVKQQNLVLRTLINNAGVMVFGEFEWQTEDQMRHQVEVNLIGTMRVTRELMPLIRAHNSRIIIVSSHCSIAPLPGVAIYSATKSAIAAWATALRVELYKYGIRVVTFLPGSFVIESNILSNQKKHFQVMRNGMSKEAHTFYGDYFDRYEKYLSALARDSGPKRLENPKIYEAFNGALLDRHPSATYKCEPFRYAVYHALFRMAPTYIRDILVESFVQMPKWRKSSNSSTRGDTTRRRSSLNSRYETRSYSNKSTDPVQEPSSRGMTFELGGSDQNYHQEKRNDLKFFGPMQHAEPAAITTNHDFDGSI